MCEYNQSHRIGILQSVSLSLAACHSTAYVERSCRAMLSLRIVNSVVQRAIAKPGPCACWALESWLSGALAWIAHQGAVRLYESNC